MIFGQNAHVGGVLETSGPADSKTDTGFEICPRFWGVIGQNKIQRTYDHDCIYVSLNFLKLIWQVKYVDYQIGRNFFWFHLFSAGTK